MADQTLAETGALEAPIPAEPMCRYTLRYKLAWRWRAACAWARYLLLRRRGLPEVVDFIFENHFFTAIQVRSELAALGEVLAEHRPERALEIGTAFGGTLLFLTRLASPKSTIVSIDLPGGNFGGGYGPIRAFFYKRLARRRQRLHLLRGDSHLPGMLGRVKGALGGHPLDYLFIDGDHSYEGVKRDFEMYGPLVTKGGLIAFHDIAEGPPEYVGGVPQFWREIKSRHRHREFVRDRRQCGFGIGVLFIDQEGPTA